MSFVSIAQFIKEEAEQQGKTPEEFFAVYKQQVRDDDEQERYELYSCALDLIQAEAKFERDIFESDFMAAREDDPAIDYFSFGVLPPYPTAILKYEKVHFHAGFKNTQQELTCLVRCTDGEDRIVSWTSYSESAIGLAEDIEFNWFTKDYQPLTF